MAAATDAPAPSTPPEWNAQPDDLSEPAPAPPAAGAPATAAAPPAPPEGALAQKRKKATAPKDLPVGQRPIDQPAENPPEWNAKPDDLSEPPPPPAPPPPLTKMHDINIGVAGYIDKMGALGGKLLGVQAMAMDKIHSLFSGKEEHGITDDWFKHTVDPYVQGQADNDLGPNATTADKATYGMAQTAAMIASAIFTGGASGEAEAPVAAGEYAPVVARAMHGAMSMTAPAATSAVDVGQKVLDATGDKRAAMTAGVASYFSNAAMGVVPAAMGAGVVAKVATGAAIGAGGAELQRRAENASLPDNMQESYDPLQTEMGAITGAAFGGYEHLATRGMVAEAKPADAVELAQQHAAEIVKEGGGDNLDQVVAATHATAAVGAVHDAAAVHQARIETRNAQVAEDAANTAAAEAEQARQQNASAAERQRDQLEHVQPAPSPDEAFAAREAENAPPDKDADFVAAKNQVGQEATDNAVNVEKGGAGEAPATVADALPPEQVGALQALRDRLAANKEPAAEPSVVDKMRAQAKGTDDDFQELPPETPKKEAPPAEEEPAATEKPSAPPDEEEPPESNPPPVTAQTLAERRAAAFDKAMADKMAGKGPTVADTADKGPVAKEESPQQGENTEPPVEGAPKAEPESPAPITSEPEVKAPTNRLSAIRAAAEKRRQNSDVIPTPRGERQFVARHPETREELGRANDFEGAMALREKHPGADIVQEDAQAPKASGAMADRREVSSLLPKGGRFVSMDEHRVVVAMPDGSRRSVAIPEEFKQQAAPEHWNKEYEEASQRQLEKGGESAPEGTPHEQPTAAPRPTKADANKAVMPVLKGLKPEHAARVQIHGDFTDMPQHLKDDAQLRTAFGPNGEPPRGVFDPKTGKIHIIASGHQDLSDIQTTMVHELAHLGNRQVLGEHYGSVLDDVARNAGAEGQRWMADYAEQHGLDLGTKVHRAHVADEYAAHLSEQPEAYTRNTLGRVYDAVRGALRKMGIVKEWTDADIRGLLRRSDNGLRNFRPDVAAREDNMSPRWASADSDTDPSLHPSDPESRAAKFGRTMQEQAGAGPGTLRSRMDWLRSGGAAVKNNLERADAKTMRSRLAFLHLDSLPDIMASMKTPKEFVRMTGVMNGRKGRLMDEGNAIGMKWNRWADGGGLYKDPESGKFVARKQGQADKGKSLQDLMHASTLSGIHPDRPYESKFGADATDEQKKIDANGKALHKKLSDTYNKLDDEGKQIYQQVKKYYEDRRQDTMNALEARIAETGASDDTKKQAMAELRKTFEQGRVQGPYFPLSRFGDHWARGVDPDDGSHVFSRFEDVIQRKRWIERAEGMGYKVEKGTKDSNKSMMEQVNPDFVKNVMAATEGHPDLQDEIWQHYLRAMPEMSTRKALIHRKGILGYSEDAMRGFAYNAFHSAHQISRLEYGSRLDGVMSRMNEEAAQIANTSKGNNAQWAPALRDEFQQRLNWIRNPKASAGASKLTQLGFAWYIGASPATAIRISTQNAMLAEPYLGARASKWGLGYNAGRGELWKAVGQWAQAKGNLGDKLRGDERAAFDEARAQGTFSSTSSQTLASGGADRPMGTGKLDAFNRVTSFMFNAMEHKNRQTTMLAAYRLARRGGLSHEEATQEGIDASNKAHFNYNNYNRPRVMQNDFMKVAALFKQYPWQVTDRLARSFRDGVMRNPELSPADRDEQLKAFAGYMGKMMLFAGIKGVPILYHATMAAINAAYGTDDKPFDAQAALREHLEQSLGKTGSDAVMDGPMSALTGAALSNGASYSDLWYKQPDRDENWTGFSTDLIGQIAGPVAGIATSAASGADIMANGDTERGLEHMTPAAVTHLMKGNRLASEGVTNLRGQQVVSPDELGQGYSTGAVGLQAVRAKNLLLQYLGFSPEVVARQYEQNSSENEFKDTITKRQQFLNEQYDNAVARGDQDAAIKWMGDMQKFHQANPGMPWSARGIMEGIRSTAIGNARANSNHGVNMKPGLQNEYDQMTGAGNAAEPQ